MGIFVFTAGNREALRHLDDSIRNPIDSEIVYQHLGQEERRQLDAVRERASDFYAWGATPGERNVPTWDRMQPGDWVLCVSSKTYRYVAQVLAKYHSPELARAIWGRDPNGRTWEYLYFLTRPTFVNRSVDDLADELNAGYRGFVEISAERVSAIEARYGGVDQFIWQRLMGDRPGSNEFLDLMRTFASEGVVFLSPVRHHRYFIRSVDDAGCAVERLDAHEPARVTASTYETSREQVKAAGGKLPVDRLRDTVAIRTTILEGPELGQSRDGTHALYLGDAELAKQSFIEVLKSLRVDTSSGEPSLYKPATLAVVLKTIESGELTANRIGFDWLAPRLLEELSVLGVQAAEQQVAYSFFHLTNDHIWLLAYKNPSRPIEGVPSPAQIRERVRHARLKEAYWRLLQNPAVRQAALEALTEQWFRKTHRRVWWVNQGHSYQEERDGGFLWAPIRNKKGNSFYYWENIARTRPGDVVLSYADGAIRAIGEVSSQPSEAERPGELPDELWERQGRRVAVRYFDIAKPIVLAEVPPSVRTTEENCPFEVTGGVKQGYLFKLGRIQSEALRTAFSRRWPRGSPWEETQVACTMEWLESETLWPREQLEEMIQTIRDRGQVILAGPPGTGKTWVAERVAKFLTEGREDRVMTVQFHPSFGYEEFVEGLRPVAEAGAIDFRIVPGVIIKLARQAQGAPGDWVLVIDEMNRANLPRVFGELMYLLEYRGIESKIDLQYSEGFWLPSNLRFIGTMNTADRSIRSIDLALRRRFEVFECPPEGEILKRYYETRTNHVENLIEGFERLNQELANLLDRHHAIGHTFFMADPMTAMKLRHTWKRQLKPLLEEYFFDQPDIANEFTIERFWLSIQ